MSTGLHVLQINGCDQTFVHKLQTIKSTKIERIHNMFHTNRNPHL